jgi:prepilin-type N-terminal cleavage/methylation domain-containing protein
MKKLMPKPKGFTIIEVIIVLVIGAVIMLAVFVVVPQLQRQNRESQMRQAAQRVLVAARQIYDSGGCPLQNLAGTTAILQNGGTEWGLETANSAGVPCSGIESVTGVIKNPVTGLAYRYWTSTGVGAPKGYIYVFNNAKCNGNTLTVGSGIAVKYGAEPYDASNQGQPRCLSE